ncbi:MAG TPA: hypothetical protein VJ972_15915 [Anaerolineales bacterium]|nr:hypothetical protein [Anaerolineales bacterium]
MVEHQPRALLVGVIEGHFPINRITIVSHIWHGPNAGALRVVGAFTGGGDPLVRRAVRDPGRNAAVQVDDGAVVGEAQTLRNEGVFTRSATHWILRVDLVRVHHHPLVTSRGQT